MTRLQKLRRWRWVVIIPAMIFTVLVIILGLKANAHFPLKLLRDVHCSVETQHKKTEWAKDHALGRLVYLPYLKKWDRAVGRCQIMPETAEWLARKFKWDSEVDLTLREHSEALAHQRLIICRQSLRRRYGKATQRAISWCYLSGDVSLWTPQQGFNGYYLDEIERKLEWVRRNRTNWMAWKIIEEGDAG